MRGQIGPYSLVCELGSGGLGTVFVAKRPLPGGVLATVALKTLNSRNLLRPDMVEMFLDEVRIIARVSHPYVCSVRDQGVVDGLPYVAMDYLVGEPLSRVIPVVSSPADIESVSCSARLLADLCEGLHAAHELRDESGTLIDLVHRDISPDNLFVLYDGTVRVVDFGIACTAELLKQGRTEVLAGKCAYMSPEQLRTEELDRRSDLWSMGVVAWELLTGRRLFHRQSDLQTAVAVLEGPLEPPSRHNPGVPSALDEVVMHALSRAREERPATARELAREFEAVVSNSFGQVPASQLGNWLHRLFPGSQEFRRRIVSRAEEAMQRGEAMLVSADSLRLREPQLEAMEQVSNDNTPEGAAEDTTHPPVATLFSPQTQQLEPLGELPPPQRSPAEGRTRTKSLISAWLDEQSSPTFSNEPLTGAGFKQSRIAATTKATPAAISADDLEKLGPAPASGHPWRRPHLMAGSAALGLSAALVAWFIWPEPVPERPAEPLVNAAPVQVEPKVAAPGALGAIPMGAQVAAEKGELNAASAPPRPVPLEIAPEAKAEAKAPARESAPNAVAASEPAAPSSRQAPKRARPEAVSSETGKVYIVSKVPEITVTYRGKQLSLPALLTLPVGPNLLQVQRAGEQLPPRRVDIKADSVTMYQLE